MEKTHEKIQCWSTDISYCMGHCADYECSRNTKSKNFARRSEVTKYCTMSDFSSICKDYVEDKE